MSYSTFLLVWTFLTIPAFSYLSDSPFAEPVRHIGRSTTNLLVVDLGYALYQGFTDSASGLNTWKGVRFGASTAGPSRWQAPKVPTVNRSTIVLSDTFGPQCPQNDGGFGPPHVTAISGSEDCLFLNVYAPPGANKLPVMVWIHGGGYGLGNGQQDLSLLMKENDNSFIGVAIQYRLGAFGFLSSAELSANGVVNAGLLDQMLALQWIQAYIERFGGDPNRVTIAGESAGAGSVMLAMMAYDGKLGTSFFNNGIAASPYLATQHTYNDSMPTYQYEQFAERAGCGSNQSRFECLVQASTEALQGANQFISTSSIWGQWSFLPVTDGIMIKDLPSRQLATRRVNGLRVLTSNSANEGANFVPANITSKPDVIAFLQLRYPKLSEAALELILDTYPSPDAPVNPSVPLFATDGSTEPTAIDQSSAAVGQQQRANNIYAEATFICSGYWLAKAFTAAAPHQANPPISSFDSNVSFDRAGYHYQYSYGQARHAYDMSAYFEAPSNDFEFEFFLAIKRMWGNFIVNNNPSISSQTADGLSVLNVTKHSAASKWPLFEGSTEDENELPMINLNITSVGSSMEDQIDLVNGWSWEGGRGARCEVWKQLGPMVPL